MENSQIIFNTIYKFYWGEKEKKLVLNNLNFTLLPGKIYGLVGLNGAGKTTIFNLIRQLTSNYYGEILVSGEDIRKTNHYLNYSCFIESENNSLILFSNYEHFSFLLDKQENYLLDNQTDFYKRYISDKKKKIIFEMSTGWKKVLAISKIFRMKKIKYLFLDEPFEGLDIIFRDILINKIKELITEGALVLISSHNFFDLENLTKNFIIIDKGELVFFGESDNLRREWDKYVEQ